MATPDYSEIARTIFAAAKLRWLQPEEIYLLLVKPKELGLQISHAHQNPSGLVLTL